MNQIRAAFLLPAVFSSIVWFIEYFPQPAEQVETLYHDTNVSLFLQESVTQLQE
jgi:hypothetical protein